MSFSKRRSASSERSDRPAAGVMKAVSRATNAEWYICDATAERGFWERFTAHAVATDKWRRISVGLWGLAALSTGLGGVFALGLTS